MFMPTENVGCVDLDIKHFCCLHNAELSAGESTCAPLVYWRQPNAATRATAPAPMAAMAKRCSASFMVAAKHPHKADRSLQLASKPPKGRNVFCRSSGH